MYWLLAANVLSWLVVSMVVVFGRFGGFCRCFIAWAGCCYGFGVWIA
jgi:hypothetical protein